MSTESRKRRRKRKKMTWKKWLLVIVGVLFLAIAGLAIKVWVDVKNTANEMHEIIPERPKSDLRDKAVTFSNQEPFSILVLGVDEREGDKGRSDTMLVMTVNPKEQSTKLVSIPRDTYTEMVGLDYQDKLNHAYAFGGVKMALASTENLLDIPLDYVVQVNMESFKEIVDAVGGVEVYNTISFDNFQEGTLHLNGSDALKYVRMRKQDPRGDFGRQDRQKQVLQAVIKKGASVNSILNYKSIFDSIGTNVRTNLTFDEIMDIQKHYRDSARKMDQLYFEKGQGKKIDGIWYYMMDEAELEEVSTELRNHLAVK